MTKPVLLVFLAASNSGGLAQLFSVPTSTWAASSPALQRSLDPQVQALTFLQAMGALVGPSVICTLLGASGIRSLRVVLSQVIQIWACCPLHLCGSTWQAAGWRRDRICCCRRIPQSAPECLFLLAKILLLNPVTPYKEGRVLSHSSPLQLGRGLSRSGTHMAQLSTLPGQCT